MVTVNRKECAMDRRSPVEQSNVPARHMEANAFLAAARAILAYDRFEDSARAIFDLMKKLIGATGGYIAMLSPDGQENEVLFLDSGGRPCTVDPSLPMPIRGLRADAYRTGLPVYDNNFARSKWMDLMPDGHVGLDSVLFAPLTFDDRIAGLLGLANKPGGFSDSDARTAGELSEFVALALKTSRDRASLEDLKSQRTEKRLAEQAAFVVNNPAPVLRVDHSGVVLDVNPAATALLGEVLTGRQVSESLPALSDILPASGYLPEPLQFEDVVGDRSFLFTVRYDAPTESYYVYGSEITERKGAENRLAEQAAFVVNNPAPVLRVDHGGIILDVNPAATVLLGKALTGRLVNECLPALVDLVPASGYLPGPLQIEDVVGDRSFLFTVRHDAPTESYYIYGSDITERKALEKLVIEAGDAQRSRIGRDLHDTLGQNLTGLSFLIHGMARELSEELPAQAEIAGKIVRQVNDSIAQVRFLAKGLTPVGLGEDGLEAALGELAGDTESLFGVSCVFNCDQTAGFDDESVTTQLYSIALEAVNNATKHAKAEHITITLTSDQESVQVVVADDGVGLPDGAIRSGGMGMHTMRYRAGVIGALLRIDSGNSPGVTVTCTLPANRRTCVEDHHE